jgi:hypothetical protein
MASPLKLVKDINGGAACFRRWRRTSHSHCCVVILERANIRSVYPREVSVHVLFNSMRPGLKRVSVSGPIPFAVPCLRPGNPAE